MINNREKCIFSWCTEADRDKLDWSGKKPLDYLKSRTSVSASTYSSEYNTSTPLMSPQSRGGSPSGEPVTLPRRSSELRGTFRKLRNHKRFATSTGVMQLTQTMLGFPAKPTGIDEVDSISNSTLSIADTDLTSSNQHEKRPRKYQSFLFKNKSATLGHKFEKNSSA